jgi:4-hydroxybenzoate polyprenyltransferase
MEDFAVTAFPQAPFARFLSCIRYRDTIILQGAPILGAVFAMGHATVDKLVALGVFAVASLLLTAHIFALNDWAGAGSDLTDPNKAPAVCLTRGVSRKQLLLLAIVFLLSSLLLLRLLGGRPFALALWIAGLSLLYSGPALQTKGVPLLSSLTHLAGGELHFLLGYSVFAPLDTLGARIAFFFALSFTAGHLTQEARDYDGDGGSGIKTNAVVFGRSQAFFAGLVLFIVGYGYLIALAVGGFVPRVLAYVIVLWPLHMYWTLRAIREGLSFKSISLLQARYRLLYVVIGVAMAAALLYQRR